jgi:hypothetical protein
VRRKLALGSFSLARRPPASRRLRFQSHENIGCAERCLRDNLKTRVARVGSANTLFVLISSQSRQRPLIGSTVCSEIMSRCSRFRQITKPGRNFYRLDPSRRQASRAKLQPILYVECHSRFPCTLVAFPCDLLTLHAILPLVCIRWKAYRRSFYLL